MATRRRNAIPNTMSGILKARTHHFNSEEIVGLFNFVNEERVDSLAEALATYISTNLPAAFERREGIADYRTNPYVLMTSASVMGLDAPDAFGTFLFNSKLYMALETSFGKQIESSFVSQYPIGSKNKWIEAPEKREEFDALEGLNREEKAQQRLNSVWREIDKSVVVGDRRYLTSIKSGPNTINDTQVQGMTRAIIDNYRTWLRKTRETYPGVNGIDVVLGLTYGTDRTTNNKENQILVKLLQNGFEEEDRETHPGVLIDSETRSVRVYRCIGMDFWSFIGRPDNRSEAKFVFLEVLLGLAKALGRGIENADIETRINLKLQQLALALTQLTFPRRSLPEWVRDDFSESQLFWFATAITAFYDEGI
ncbi:PmeII family type II restriction endonuclease [Burkholderia stagnalis]|uniref:PmeII family type II restriction endonuclease n=1 Tax=Burkholderia stagnalis TaxID=1503054 RepID=UPI0009C0AAEC|nr:PmeII family type II restriction endonuclease [Burkholderia stagnalis]